MTTLERDCVSVSKIVNIGKMAARGSLVRRGLRIGSGETSVFCSFYRECVIRVIFQ